MGEGSSGLAAGVHALSLDGPRRALPAVPADESPTTDALAGGADAVEEEALMGLVTTALQDAGRALTIADVSASLAARTGHRWTAYFEPRYGPLLTFLKAHIVPGYHIITRNKVSRPCCHYLVRECCQ